MRAARLLAALALALTAHPAAAQDTKPLAFDGKLTRDDAPDRLRKESFHKAHEVELKAGIIYIIDLVSKDFDPFLRLEDDKGKPLAENDDVSDTDLNARLTITPPKTGKYRLVVTSYAGGATGAYRLTVRPAGDLARLQQMQALSKRGIEHFQRGEQAEARRLFAEALAAARQLFPKADYPDGHPSLATCLNSLGTALFVQGQLDGARVHLEEALAVRRKTLAPGHLDVAQTLKTLGAVLQAQGQFDAALAPLQEALAIREKALPADHPLIGISLSSLGSLLHAQGKMDEARRSMERALAINRKALPPDHPDLATSLNNLAVLLREQGKYADARAHLEEALAAQKKALPAGHPHLAATLGNLGEVLKDQGKLDEARDHHERALAIKKKALPPEHPDVATSLNNLGFVLHELGRPDEAREHYQRALAIYDKALAPNHPEVATCLANLGKALHVLGRLDEARPCYERAVAVQRKALPRHPVLANSLAGLAGLLAAQGRAAEARAAHEEALVLRRKALPPGHPDLAQSLHHLGVLLHREGRLKEARGHYEEALAVFTEALPRDHPNRAATSLYLGSLLRTAGDLAGAGSRLDEALAILRRALPKDHPHLSAALDARGHLLRARGEADAARACYEEALAISRRSLPPGHPHLATGLSNLGALLWAAGRHDEAWPQLAAAVGAWAAHVRRVAAGSAQRDHLQLVAKDRYVLDALLAAAWQSESLTESQRLDLLLRLLEGKGISAAALARRRESLLREADPEARALADKLAPLQRRLADLLLQGPGHRPPAEYRDECRRLEAEADDLERALAKSLRLYAALRDGDRAGPEEVAARLPAGTVLVETVRYQPTTFKAGPGEELWEPPQYAAVLLWGGGPKEAARVRWVPLGPAAPLEAAVAAWRAQVQRGEGKPGGALSRLLWAPLAKALPEKTERLLVAPDGQLALVPLEALEGADGKYLIESMKISYVSTGRDVMPAPGPERRAAGAVIVADPDYDAGGKAAGAALRFRPLAGFGREADAVAKLLGGRPGWEVRSLRGAAATEEALLKTSRPRLLHCVTHGFFLKDVERRPPDPGLREFELVGGASGRPALPNFGADPRLQSGLALAGANRWQERSAKGLSDGLLTALEVEHLDLWGTELVVLSACETGLGEIQNGEGVLGLRRAFQLAGAQTVLASLWKIPDAETERLMTDTLSRWLRGAPPHQALREAQLSMIRQLREIGARNGKQEAPPLFWAGFICHGPQ